MSCSNIADWNVSSSSSIAILRISGTANKGTQVRLDRYPAENTERIMTGDERVDYYYGIFILTKDDSMRCKDRSMYVVDWSMYAHKSSFA